MKKYILLLTAVFVSFGFICASQDKPKDNPPASATLQERVYELSMVEMRPYFPGGDAEMYRWIAENMNYPAAAAEDGASGRVVVEFVINKDGSISNARVVRSRHPALDQEALRLVNSMPRWIPGRNDGKLVNVTYCLPISFRLQ